MTDEIAQMLRDDARKALRQYGAPERPWETCPEGERRYWRARAHGMTNDQTPILPGLPPDPVSVCRHCGGRLGAQNPGDVCEMCKR